MGARNLLLFLPALFLALEAAADIVTQKSVVNGVAVAVTAGNLGPDSTVWDFAVVLSSPRRNLPDNLVQSAVLVDSKGRHYKALIWEGAPAEGDHRGGVLKFIAPEPRPIAVELRIVRVGEKKPRTFGFWLGSGLIASPANSASPGSPPSRG
jgi:hypothetical protein